MRGMPDGPNTSMLLIRIHLIKNEDYRSCRDSQLQSFDGSAGNGNCNKSRYAG